MPVDGCLEGLKARTQAAPGKRAPGVSSPPLLPRPFLARVCSSASAADSISAAVPVWRSASDISRHLSSGRSERPSPGPWGLVEEGIEIVFPITQRLFYRPLKGCIQLQTRGTQPVGRGRLCSFAV